MVEWLPVRFLWRHPVLAPALLVAALAIGLVAASALAVWRTAHSDDASRVAHAEVVLVLGAAQYAGRPSPVFQGRLDHAALLYRQGFAERVLVLGAGQPGDEVTEAEAGMSYLVDAGIPGEDVAASSLGGTTYESLGGAAAWMQERDLESAFLVSDPWHNLRMKRMAKDLGIRAYASATWHSAARSQGTRLAGYVRETFAYLYYRMFRR